MADPPTKRPRRCQQARAAGKRKLAHDTASPTEKRSRKAANSEAERLLDPDVAVGDAQMLRVLRLWKFSGNATRTNVTPRDEAFVLSDTLGLVATRTGVVTVSRLTRRYPAVFELFCYWVRRAWPLALPFPFTSINVNYGYAAKLHRAQTDDACSHDAQAPLASRP